MTRTHNHDSGFHDEIRHWINTTTFHAHIINDASGSFILNDVPLLISTNQKGIK